MNETQEYLDIMAGKKHLELEYKEGEFISGYTANGLSARIIESLHCGQYIPNWGFLVDREFEDGDIEKMKRHFFQWKELEETQNQLMKEETEACIREKENMLSDVIWDYRESYEIDGSRSFLHSITIKNHTYKMREKKVQGMGRMIVPEYEIGKEAFDEPLAQLWENNWYWTYISFAKEEKIKMKEEEERAFQIILKYGQLK